MCRPDERLTDLMGISPLISTRLDTERQEFISKSKTFPEEAAKMNQDKMLLAAPYGGSRGIPEPNFDISRATTTPVPSPPPVQMTSSATHQPQFDLRHISSPQTMDLAGDFFSYDLRNLLLSLRHSRHQLEWS